MNAAKATAISDLVVDLSDELREVAMDIVNSAPLVSDNLIPVPIAHPDGKYAERIF
jgi:hypothetical protein